MATHHATCLEIAGLGVLLRGPSGAGKSDLALRLLEGTQQFPARLVADDRVCLTRDREDLIASPPPVLRGLLEIRGVGLVRLPVCERIALGLVVELVGRDAVERAPEFPATRVKLEAVALPVLHLNPFEASAPARLRMAVRQILVQDGRVQI